MDIFLARQPIFDKDQLVIAYELLYRNSKKNAFDITISSNVATSILLMNSYLNFGIKNVIGNEKAYINFDTDLITADIPLLLEKDDIVIELMETIIPDKAFISRIASLVKKGYTLAMDDYVADYPYDELTKLCHIIKVDFLLNTKEQIQAIVKKWKPRGKILLAEKVETIEVFEWASDIGFHYFQGYFFSKPSVFKSKELQQNPFQYLKLMNELNQIQPDNHKIARLIETDVTLTYRLLKLVNSSFSLISHVNSVTHALSLLGSTAFKKWLTLAMVQITGDNKPPELIKTSLIRSGFMEKIALDSSLKSHAPEINLMGILSVIDALLEKPMNKALESLPLSQDIKDTLLDKKTKYSPVYEIVKAYEKGSFDCLEALCQEIHYDYLKAPKAYYESITWAEELYNYMQNEKGSE